MRSNKRKLALGAGLAAWLFSASLSFATPSLISGSATGNAGCSTATGSVACQTQASGVGAAITATFTGSNAIPVGSLIVVAVTARTTGAGWSSCTDTAGNSYAPGSADYPAGVTNVELFYSITTVAIALGMTTITCTAAGSSTAPKSMEVLAFSNASGGFDASANAYTSSGTAFSPAFVVPASGALSTSSDLVIAAVANSTSATTTAEGSGFTGAGGTTASSYSHLAYSITYSNAQVNYAPTFSTAGALTGQMQAFKPSGGAPSVVCTRSLMGVGPC